MRTYRRLRVQLKKRDRDELDRVLNGGIQPVRVVLRSLALFQLYAGKSVSEVAANVHLTSKAVREIGRRYQDAGLERALYSPKCGQNSERKQWSLKDSAAPPTNDWCEHVDNERECPDANDSGNKSHPVRVAGLVPPDAQGG